MANLKRVRVQWSGSGVVGPGVSTFYFLEAASGFTADLLALFNGCASQIPAEVDLVIPSSGETIDLATGQPNGVWSEAGGGTSSGGGASQYAAGVGARLRWLTGGFSNGRRVVGTTFIVPVVAALFDADGTLAEGGRAALAGAAEDFVAAQGTDFVVYTRPKGGAGGATAGVTGYVVPDQVSWLRSRRS